MPAVVADHGETARQRRDRASRHGAYRRTDAAIQAATALQQVSTIPLQRKAQLETDAVFNAAKPLALVDGAFHHAVIGQHHARLAELAFTHARWPEMRAGIGDIAGGGDYAGECIATRGAFPLCIIRRHRGDGNGGRKRGESDSGDGGLVQGFPPPLRRGSE